MNRRGFLGFFAAVIAALGFSKAIIKDPSPGSLIGVQDDKIYYHTDPPADLYIVTDLHGAYTTLHSLDGQQKRLIDPWDGILLNDIILINDDSMVRLGGAHPLSHT